MDHIMTKEEKFAIFWCFSKAMKYIEVDEFCKDKDIVVNGININETIRKLLSDRLFV